MSVQLSPAACDVASCEATHRRKSLLCRYIEAAAAAVGELVLPDFGESVKLRAGRRMSLEGTQY